MTALPIALSIVGLLALGVAIWALVELGRASRSLRELSDETRERLVPLLDKADVTIDAANAELWRIDGAITRFEEASVRVGAASGTLSEIVQHPGEVVSGVADRVRKAWRERRRSTDVAAPPAGEAVRTSVENDTADESQKP